MKLESVRSGAFVWKLARPISENEEWLSAPQRMLGDDRKLLKPSDAGSGTRVVLVETRAHSLVFKEYRAANWRERCRSMVRGPRALRTLKIAARLQALGIPAIRPVAAGHEAGKPWHSILVTEKLSPAMMLYDYAGRSRRHRSKIIAPLARILAELHNARLSHRDAHDANFVVRAENGPELFMVDVDGVRQAGRVSLRQAAREISRLIFHMQIPRWEKLRFLVVYSRARRPAISAREFAALFPAEPMTK